VGVSVGGGGGGGSGVGVGVDRGGRVKLIMTVGVGGRGGWGVTVGTRVLVGVGSARVGVTRPAVGKKLGRVDVHVGEGAGKVAVGGAGRRR